MFESDSTKAKQIQSDVLLESLSSNEYFTSHTLQSLNKALNTTDKRIVGAINEIMKKQTSLQSATQNAINQQFSVLGDVLANPELLTKLQKVSTNLIEAVSKHDEEIKEIKETVPPQEKQVCFVIPRVNITTKSPEVFFPFKGTITKLVASVSSSCLNRDDDDAAIPIDIQYLSDNEWRKIVDIEIAKGECFATKNFNDDSLVINNKSIRIKINSLPANNDTTDVSVILYLTINN